MIEIPCSNAKRLEWISVRIANVLVTISSKYNAMAFLLAR
jgi:hypothetical protein